LYQYRSRESEVDDGNDEKDSRLCCTDAFRLDGLDDVSG